ncbi:hypothetical protein ASPZODRAFT_64076 [Penicilliopsis zonata CBS 506.65]|uniref:Zn(2)-C6 fungal-type domain-containing protein n=1 Tax=Penicilliopsis zonata CBS 506.65 TaxID=1073090 RepID=A0A1L9SKH8_9EURO|nr:hypothetical protein ASPZODRAFT_64076 [Penicilliopsis zonata CBS 506.65]OJJ47708.1 hypothetical protein ASPZODRAFT_64076 [Penicilliopsis zonata CBS 506.65]
MSTTVPNRSPPRGGEGISKRKPGSAACIHCHRRKVRCDARVVGLPCSNCRSSGKTDCRIHEKKKRLAARSILDPVPIRCRPPSFSPTTDRRTLPAPLLVTPVYDGTSAQQGATGVTGVTSPLQRRGSDLNQDGVRRDSDGAAYSITSTTSNSNNTHINIKEGDSSGENDGSPGLENRLARLIDEEESGRREIQRGVRAIYVGHDVSNMSFLIRQQRDNDDEVYHFAGNEIPRRQLRTGHDQLLMDALTLPEQALADELVEAYFTHVNPGYPIVDEDLFMTQYRNRDPTDAPPVLLLQAILLVGSHVARPKAERDALKDIFFRRTKWLFDNRIERNRDILVQVALLLTWHSDVADDDVAANAHYWVGVAARIATGLGMHRNPVSSRFVSRDRRMWKRLWYILLQFDVMVSLSYGRPQAINLEDSDVAPLTPSDFQGCGPHVQIDFVIQFTELCTMISYIVRERFGLRVSAERRKAILMEADEALANWSLKLPDTVRLRASDMDPWSAMLHLTYNNFLILLHRPHPRASAYSDDYGPHDAEICSAAAGVIASIFEELRLNNRLKFLWYSGVHTLFTAMIQVRVELRFSNPVLAINALRRFDSASYSLRVLAEYWTHAGTILGLFEDSKRLQEDLRMATSERPKQFNSNGSKNPTNDGKTNQKSGDNKNLEFGGSSSASASETEGVAPVKPHHPAPSSYDVRGSDSPPLHAPPHSEFAWPSAASENQERGGVFLGLSAVESIDQPREQLDWRQLFSFTDLDQPVPMAVEGLPELEDEWRQIYWQENSMSDLFQDGGWMHG